jgi:hypothetical protein
MEKEDSSANSGNHICALCGKTGAKNSLRTIHWPGEKIHRFVHPECEAEECARAYGTLTFKQRDDFLHAQNAKDGTKP